MFSLQTILQSLQLNAQNAIQNDEVLKLSKLRIIQKNLVHCQGFPDAMLNKQLLSTREFFGQFGKILKLVISSKEVDINKKKANSAYITFENKFEAALCILAIDSITIEGSVIRAFFGTSKYCLHFLNHTECLNKDKCTFIHEFADSSDILGAESKFGYPEHIKLAKEIVNYYSIETLNLIKNFNLPYNTFLPSIKTIYDKTCYFGENHSDKDDSRINLSLKNLSSCLLSNSNALNSNINFTINLHIQESTPNQNILEEISFNINNNSSSKSKLLNLLQLNEPTMPNERDLINKDTSKLDDYYMKIDSIFVINFMNKATDYNSNLIRLKPIFKYRNNSRFFASSEKVNSLSELNVNISSKFSSFLDDLFLHIFLYLPFVSQYKVSDYYIKKIANKYKTDEMVVSILDDYNS